MSTISGMCEPQGYTVERKEQKIDWSWFIHEYSFSNYQKPLES
jgi:hypothetical protein